MSFSRSFRKYGCSCMCFLRWNTLWSLSFLNNSKNVSLDRFDNSVVIWIFSGVLSSSLKIHNDLNNLLPCRYYFYVFLASGFLLKDPAGLAHFLSSQSRFQVFPILIYVKKSWGLDRKLGINIVVWALRQAFLYSLCLYSKICPCSRVKVTNLNIIQNLSNCISGQGKNESVLFMSHQKLFCDHQQDKCNYIHKHFMGLGSESAPYHS